MKILIGNDDGINANGLRLLAEAVQPFSEEIYIAAPKENCSGVSHKVSFFRPLDVARVSLDWADDAIIVDGSPVDALRIAILEVFKDKEFDLVLSGINRGGNLGHDVFYSGTTAYALDAFSMGFNSIAFSQVWGKMLEYSAISKLIDKIVKKFIQPVQESVEASSINKIANRFCLNVNFPPVPADEIKGIKYTLLSGFHFGDVYTSEKKSLFDEQLVRYVASRESREAEQTEESLQRKYPTLVYDQEAINAGYVSITPITDDIINRDLLRNFLNEQNDFEI